MCTKIIFSSPLIIMDQERVRRIIELFSPTLLLYSHFVYDSLALNQKESVMKKRPALRPPPTPPIGTHERPGQAAVSTTAAADECHWRSVRRRRAAITTHAAPIRRSHGTARLPIHGTERVPRFCQSARAGMICS